MTSNEFLYKIWDEVNLKKDYDTDWDNERSFPTYAVDLSLNPGIVVKSISADGRLVLLIGTRFKTIVLVQKDISYNSNVLIHLPRFNQIVRLLLDRGAFNVFPATIKQLELITGYHIDKENKDKLIYTQNIGSYIEEIASCFILNSI